MKHQHNQQLKQMQTQLSDQNQAHASSMQSTIESLQQDLDKVGAHRMLCVCYAHILNHRYFPLNQYEGYYQVCVERYDQNQVYEAQLQQLKHQQQQQYDIYLQQQLQQQKQQLERNLAVERARIEEHCEAKLAVAVEVAVASTR